MLLPTDVWAGALIRRAELAGAFAMVLRKGDARAGTVLVKVIDRRDRSVRVYAEAFRGDGERVWMEPVRADDRESHGVLEAVSDPFRVPGVLVDAIEP